ncbi:VOC family protein [Sinomonas sp. JGH33]|uniref:VOC family protein n=1 Tax=Sinomonas terricola TaxID=3110330 RepID=A0ABU5T1M4_9MICC|nr:VOC family protein [Sinomonas sp. JGH33]MEA5453568.1 VOC family protein [Sinomonas sp. JGH33]
MAGQVVHFEIPADDASRASTFYSEAFGWNIMPVPGMDYTMVGTTPSGETGAPLEPGAINGGMYTRNEQFPQSPVVTVDVDDIDAALAKIESLGGSTVAPKIPVGEMGFAAYFKDTEGNVLGLWQNTPQAPAE